MAETATAMSNPPPILTDELLQKMIDCSIQKAIAKHELRFCLYGLPLILIVLVGLWLK